MEMIKIRFDFSRDDRIQGFTGSFDAADSSLQTTVEEEQERLVELNENWAFDGYEIVDYDKDFASPDNFDNLDDYGEYAENVEEYGNAFHMRWDDLGSLDERQFLDSYRGSFKDSAEYARSRADSCGDVPEHLERYIDWETYGDDLLNDCSQYEDDGGIHVFDD
jgi:antirestriction protein